MKRIEATSVLALLFACVLLTACAEPAMRYMGATAAGLHFPSPYIEAVLSTRARPGPTQSGAAEGSP